MRALCRVKVQERIPKIAGSRSPCTSGHPSAADFLDMWMSHRDNQVVIRLQNFGDLRQRKASINPGSGDQFKPRHNKLIWQHQLFPKLLFQGTERLANDFHFMGNELSHDCSRHPYMLVGHLTQDPRHVKNKLYLKMPRQPSLSQPISTLITTQSGAFWYKHMRSNNAAN